MTVNPGVRYEVAADGCWNWLGYIDANGYGTTGVWGRQTPVHRAAYELLVGPIPPNHQVHHTCRNRRCLNPAHLEAMHVGFHQQQHPHQQPRDQCKHGHPFTEANTYVRANGDRQCRACKARRERERQQRLRVAAGKTSRYPSIRALDQGSETRTKTVP